jgi:hypothetical protein
LVIFCVAIFTSIYVHAGNKVAVLAVARDIPQGHAISRSDLVIVRISFSPGLTPIPEEDFRNVIGRAAAVPLVQGTLLSSSELTALRGPPRGEAIVGVATKTGQLPAGGVTVGNTVDVILTGSPATLTGGAPDGSATGSSASGGEVEIGGVLAPDATVTGVAPPTESSADTTVVSVLIPSAMAPLVASASASGQAALVLVGSGS